MPVKFTASRFMGQITLKGGTYSIEFPDDEFQDWLAFYERMNEKYGKSSASYAAAVDALRDLDVSGNPVDA